MKIKVIPILFIVFLLFQTYGCDSYVQSHRIITPEKNANSVHVGQGVWMNIPSPYVRANSYDGFQTPNNSSSISVKISSFTMKELKRQFNFLYLQNKNIDLLEFSTLSFGDNDNAFFAMVHDNNKGTIRYLLAVNDGRRTYNIKAFCFEDIFEHYDSSIKDALFSSFIGETVKEEEVFKLAKIKSNKTIYTKDGKYPTESVDQSVIEIEEKESVKGIVKKRLLEKELEYLTGSLKHNIQVIEMVGVKYYYGAKKTKEKVAYVGLFALKNGQGIFVKAFGNQQAKLSDFEDFIQKEFLRVYLIP